MKARATLTLASALLAAVALFAVCASQSARAATATKTTLTPDDIAKFKRVPYTPPDIAKIEAAEKAGDYKLAVQLEDDVIGRSASDPQGRWTLSWIRALALYDRFTDRQQLGAPHKEVLGDLLASARLGNLAAIRQAEDILEEHLVGMNPTEYPPLTDSDVVGIFKIGAELADPPSALAYGAGVTSTLHAPLPDQEKSKEEKLFWILLAYQADTRMSRDQRRAMINAGTKIVGAEATAGALSQLEIAGGTTQSTPGGVPGRDIFTALEAEVDLRAEYSLAYPGGAGVAPAEAPHPEMSVGEYFDDTSVMENDVGLGRVDEVDSQIT
jgi:hypothetical protein